LCRNLETIRYKRGFNLRKNLLTLVVLTFLLTAFAFPAPAGSPSIYVNDALLSPSVPPVVENGTTLVPLRVIFQSLGAEVNWEGSTQTVTAVKDGITIKLTIGNKTAYKNNVPVTLLVPAKIIRESTMVPLRFVSESLGTTVNWNSATRTITITSPYAQPVKFTQVHFWMWVRPTVFTLNCPTITTS
jgi:hypothetical protein